MRHRRLLLPMAVLVVPALALTACDDAADASQVDIIDNGYSPGTVEVGAGETVEWEHTGEIPHTVTFDDGEGSGSLDGGDTYQRTFDEAGAFDYVCDFHPAMQGTVIVDG